MAGWLGGVCVMSCSQGFQETFSALSASFFWLVLSSFQGFQDTCCALPASFSWCVLNCSQGPQDTFSAIYLCIVRLMCTELPLRLPRLLLCYLSIVCLVCTDPSSRHPRNLLCPLYKSLYVLSCSQGFQDIFSALSAPFYCVY